MGTDWPSIKDDITVIEDDTDDVMWADWPAAIGCATLLAPPVPGIIEYKILYSCTLAAVLSALSSRHILLVNNQHRITNHIPMTDYVDLLQIKWHFAWHELTNWPSVEELHDLKIPIPCAVSNVVRVPVSCVFTGQLGKAICIFSRLTRQFLRICFIFQWKLIHNSFLF